jgi:hypothetical protein
MKARFGIGRRCGRQGKSGGGKQAHAGPRQDFSSHSDSIARHGRSFQWSGALTKNVSKAPARDTKAKVLELLGIPARSLPDPA